MTYKHTILSLVILIAVLTTAWPTLFSFRRPNKMTTIITDLPDAFMDDVTQLVMDKEGKLKIKIVTPKVIHFFKGDTTRLISPHLTLYRNSPEPWHITAKFAKASQGVLNVNFWDDVRIQHLNDEKSPMTLIKTTTLTVYPDKHTAETPELITMIQPNMIVKAIGMFADMDSGDIKLLSKARGEYVPDS